MAEPGNKQKENSTRSIGVEIQGVAKLFRTKALATADILFIPLVASAKRAMALAEEVAKANPEARTSTELLARTYLAGMMLEDPSFVISSSPLSDEDRFVIDVGAGTFYSRMWINAAHEKRKLLLQAELSGKIKEGLYEVKDLRDQSTLLQFSEGDAQQKNFFTEVMPERCLVEIIQRERSSLATDHDDDEGAAQIVLSLQIGGSKVMISLQREGDTGPWEVYDARSKVKLGDLPTVEEDRGKGLADEVISFLRAGHKQYLDNLPTNTKRSARGRAGVGR